MSGTLNKVMLIGHLGDDVKIHRFEDGGCVGRFPLATNETYLNRQTNERVSNTEWHNIVLRNKAAEICEKYLSKGDKVKFTIRFKGRELQHSSLGSDLMEKIKQDMQQIGRVELQPKFDGKQMIMVIQPL